MSKLNDKELKGLQDVIKAIETDNAQIAQFNYGAYKAAESRAQNEEKLEKLYSKLLKKYQKTDDPIQINIDNGEVTVKEVEE